MTDNERLTGLIQKIYFDICSDIALSSADLAFLQQSIHQDLPDRATSELIDAFKLIGDPKHAPLIEPFLNKGNANYAAQAIWTLSWLGLAERYKTYIIDAVEPGFSWDERRYIASNAIGGAGLHLKTHHDRDFAQLIIRWITREDDDPFYAEPHPLGISPVTLRSTSRSARTAAGYAMGADPFKLVDDKALVAACVQRFVAERQEG